MYNVNMPFAKLPNKSLEFKKRKEFIGLLYGITSGIAFAIFAWGADAFLLAQANTMHFWMKFVPGLVLSILVGSLAGWITIRFEKHGIALITWGLVAVFYTWLVIWLPASGIKFFTQLIDPHLANLQKFSEIDSINQFRIFGFFTIGLPTIICGLLEINLVEQVLLSSHNSSLVIALSTCLIVMGLAGSASDYLINIHFREPIQALNKTIDIAVSYRDGNISDKIAREQHVYAINHLKIDLNKPRKMALISFDQTLGNMNVLVDFEGVLVKCNVIYSQTSNCVLVPGIQ